MKSFNEGGTRPSSRVFPPSALARVFLPRVFLPRASSYTPSFFPQFFSSLKYPRDISHMSPCNSAFRFEFGARGHLSCPVATRPKLKVATYSNVLAK